MKYKLVASDMDGTMLNDRKVIAERNSYAIEILLQKGIKVAIATGRSFLSIEEFVNQHKFDYAICLNGAYIYDIKKQEVLHTQLLDDAVVRTIVKEARAFDVSVQAFQKDMFYTEKETAHVLSYYADAHVPYKMFNADCDFINGAFKVLITGEFNVIDKFHMHIKNIYGDEVASFKSSPTYLEFVHKKVGKGEALNILTKKIGIKMTETIAVGDFYNDMTMIRSVGYSIVPSNAVEELKAVATLVSNKDNNEGVLEEILNLV